jgi:hypothetical protein
MISFSVGFCESSFLCDDCLFNLCASFFAFACFSSADFSSWLAFGDLVLSVLEVRYTTAAAYRTTLTPACSLQTLVVESYTFHPAVTSSTTPASFWSAPSA